MSQTPACHGQESSAACEQRVFIETWSAGEESVSGLCRLFGISRVTGHKRINRYREYGFDGLGGPRHRCRTGIRTRRVRRYRGD